jgi:hypothetical protein
MAVRPTPLAPQYGTSPEKEVPECFLRALSTPHTGVTKRPFVDEVKATLLRLFKYWPVPPVRVDEIDIEVIEDDGNKN